MKKHVTVVPSDRLIIVEGEALQFDFAAPENLHAVQWHNGEGHMEFLDDMNHPLTEGDYAEDVAPFVTAWETEKARLEDEAAAAEAARVAAYNAPEARAARIRAERDRRLEESAWIVERHRDQLDNGEETALTDAGYQEWLGIPPSPARSSRPAGIPVAGRRRPRMSVAC